MSGLSNKTFGAIGTGNMCSAILKGVLANNLFSGKIHFVELHDAACQWLVEAGHVRHRTIADLLQHADVVMLAIKPQGLTSVGEELRGALTARHCLISILAGITLERLGAAVGTQAALVRVMPNLGATVSMSMSAVVSHSKEAETLTEEIFRACGRTLVLGEDKLDAFTAVAGSGPAYFFNLMAAMEDSAVAMGFNREQANLMVTQTAAGAAQVAQSTGVEVPPLEWKKRVTSKGGTTAAALDVFDEHNLHEITHKALQAASDRSKELAKL